MSKCAIGVNHKRGRKRKTESTHQKIFTDEEDEINGEPRYRFHIDFGFFRGSVHRIK